MWRARENGSADRLDGYKFQQTLVWHAGNRCRLTSAQEPSCPETVLSIRSSSTAVRAPTARIVSGDKEWDTERHVLTDLCHVAPVPESTYKGEDLKQHPLPKPVSVMHGWSTPSPTPESWSAPCSAGFPPAGWLLHPDSAGLSGHRAVAHLPEATTTTASCESTGRCTTPTSIAWPSPEGSDVRDQLKDLKADPIGRVDGPSTRPSVSTASESRPSQLESYVDSISGSRGSEQPDLPERLGGESRRSRVECSEA